MNPPVEAPGGETRQALAAGIVCSLLWGLMPALFIVMHRAGASPWEIVGQRALWSAPWAAGLVLLAGLGGAVRALLARPRALGLLAASAMLIGGNWSVDAWARQPWTQPRGQPRVLRQSTAQHGVRRVDVP